MKKILLIGGAGYIGTEITRFFLTKNYHVICYDNFIYNHLFSVNEFIKNKNYTLINDDLRNLDNLSKLIDGISDIILLAGLVGDPITKKYPKISNEINLNGIKNFLKILNKYSFNKLIFISTCSNYGLIKNEIFANEDHPLDPLSLYAKSKVEIENYILSNSFNLDFSPVILRFSTAFGLSTRMRFDLTINEFTQTLINGDELLIYDADTWRPYCHVKDFARVIFKIINSDNELVKNQVFNVGSNQNNFTKRDIITKILEYIPDGVVKYKNKGSDPRNYKVNFKKLEDMLNIKDYISIEEGIKEIIEFNKNNKIQNYKDIKFGNYKINE